MIRERTMRFPPPSRLTPHIESVAVCDWCGKEGEEITYGRVTGWMSLPPGWREGAIGSMIRFWCDDCCKPQQLSLDIS